MERDGGSRIRPGGILDLPELNVAIFAFLLNLPWEFLQVPLYLAMPEASHWDAIKTCTRATFGDALIMVVGYWAVAVLGRHRWWILRPRFGQLLGFAGAGVFITTIIEQVALRSADPDWGWRYAPAMPVVPFIDIGLSPLLQWMLLPPLTAWFVKRQLAHLVRPGAP